MADLLAGLGALGALDRMDTPLDGVRKRWDTYIKPRPSAAVGEAGGAGAAGGTAGEDGADARDEMEMLKAGCLCFLASVKNYAYSGEEGRAELTTLKTALERRRVGMDRAMETAESLRRWVVNLGGNLDEFTRQMGRPRYTGGDPYGGGRARLVDTPVNHMVDFVNRQIKAAEGEAEKMFGHRHREEMARRVPYDGGV